MRTSFASLIAIAAGGIALTAQAAKSTLTGLIDYYARIPRSTAPGQQDAEGVSTVPTRVSTGERLQPEGGSHGTLHHEPEPERRTESRTRTENRAPGSVNRCVSLFGSFSDQDGVIFQGRVIQ